MIKRIVLFLVLNFGALAIGSRFTSAGVASLWYQNLNKAPWTPPGWVFGAAWTIIMLAFAIYMAYLVKDGLDKKKKVVLFAIQWVLNVSWNPIFFYGQHALAGLVCISLLTLLIIYLFMNYLNELTTKSVLLVPYIFWLLIATSLNAYIFINN
jgi:tryptophan-rich sensory protein